MNESKRAFTPYNHHEREYILRDLRGRIERPYNYLVTNYQLLHACVDGKGNVTFSLLLFTLEEGSGTGSMRLARRSFSVGGGQRDDFRNFFYEQNAGKYVKRMVELAGISGF